MNNVVQIIVSDKRKCRWIKYWKGIKFLGIQIRKEGFYYFGMYGKEYLSEEDLLTSNVIIDGKVAYAYPNITFYFVDKSTKEIQFETNSDLEKYLNNLLSRWSTIPFTILRQ
jgi:hypothetical protein